MNCCKIRRVLSRGRPCSHQLSVSPKPLHRHSIEPLQVPERILNHAMCLLAPFRWSWNLPINTLVKFATADRL
jgi:hypothetical protein